MAKTITEKFNEIKHENVGAIVTLNRVIEGSRFTKKQVSLAFHKLVPKDEYDKSEKAAILKDCYSKLA